MSASRASISYLGCFEADVTALGITIPVRLILVIKEVGKEAAAVNPPCILGMNVLREYWSWLFRESSQGLPQ